MLHGYVILGVLARVCVHLRVVLVLAIWVSCRRLVTKVGVTGSSLALVLLNECVLIRQFGAPLLISILLGRLVGHYVHRV